MYIDPAAGSLILQVLVAGLLAVGTMLRTVRQSVAHFVRQLFSRRKDR